MNNSSTIHLPARRINKLLTVFVILPLLYTILPNHVMAQENKQMVRIAKIKVDPLQLEKYNAALKEQMASAIRLEPGVLSYYAVADKKDASNITILEVYANVDAYNAHILTPHFKKYKETVKDMVKQLELIDVTLLAAAKQPGF